MDRLTTSEKVSIELKRKSMTQEDLAEKLNVTPMTISRRIESNAWKPMEVYFMKHNLHFDL
jgi:transcriptional regulator with XRE-family HTH domain